ncbi:MAG TPA: hypothetical protein PKE64_29340 [Anaerolineae bacterium]|nr:hypothetical protein [Anaerolineae bacterium]HMR68137.1 hypothetical protein [Anaerolineae bacterium]
MELHERQQFDFLLLTAVDRYVERIVQRNQGAANALHQLRQDPQGEGLWLDQFVEALFQDFLLDNTAGACFILKALDQQPGLVPAEGKIETILRTLARRTFAGLLRRKTEEFLEQQASLYGDGSPE